MLLAETGYYRHAFGAPALGGVGVNHDYLSKPQIGRARYADHDLAPLGHPYEFWLNDLEKDFLAAAQKNDLAKVKSCLAKKVDPVWVSYTPFPRDQILTQPPPSLSQSERPTSRAKSQRANDKAWQERRFLRCLPRQY